MALKDGRMPILLLVREMDIYETSGGADLDVEFIARSLDEFKARFSIIFVKSTAWILPRYLGSLKSSRIPGITERGGTNEKPHSPPINPTGSMERMPEYNQNAHSVGRDAWDRLFPQVSLRESAAGSVYDLLHFCRKLHPAFIRIDSGYTWFRKFTYSGKKAPLLTDPNFLR